MNFLKCAYFYRAQFPVWFKWPFIQLLRFDNDNDYFHFLLKPDLGAIFYTLSQTSDSFWNSKIIWIQFWFFKGVMSFLVSNQAPDFHLSVKMTQNVRCLIRYRFVFGHFDRKAVEIFLKPTKGQLNSEWIYDVIVSPKIPTKNYRDLCPGSLLKGRAEISVIFGWYFGRNNDLINSFWI